jgi:hypothetical protein
MKIKDENQPDRLKKIAKIIRLLGSNPTFNQLLDAVEAILKIDPACAKKLLCEKLFSVATGSLTNSEIHSYAERMEIIDPVLAGQWLAKVLNDREPPAPEL